MAKETQVVEKRFDRLSCFLPAAAVALIIITGIAYYLWIGLGGTNDVTSSQLLYAVSIEVLCTAQWWNFVVALLIVSYSINKYGQAQRTKRWLILALLLIVAGVSGYFIKSFGGNSQSSLFCAIQCIYHVDVNRIETLNNIITTIAVMAILYSLCLLAGPNNMINVRRSADSVQWFTLSLYSAAAFLAAGIFEIFSAFTWGWEAQDCVDKKTCAIAPEDFAMSGGIMLSVMLIIMYLPTAIIMDRRMRALFYAVPEDKRTEGYSTWIQQVGLPTSPLKAVGSYGAILLPFVTGILTRAIHLHPAGG